MTEDDELWEVCKGWYESAGISKEDFLQTRARSRLMVEHPGYQAKFTEAISSYIKHCPSKAIIQDRYMRKAEVAVSVHLSDSKLDELVAKGAFPSPVQIGNKKVWDRRTVAVFMDAKKSVAELETAEKQRKQSVIPTRIPPKARVHRPLEVFDCEVDAYRAGNFFGAAIYKNGNCQRELHRFGTDVRSLTTGGGGYLVPDELQSTLIAVRERRGIYPQYSNFVPMESGVSNIPRLLGGTVAYWKGETVSITGSDSDELIGNNEMKAKKLFALTKVTAELDEDAIVDMAEVTTKNMAYAMADKVDRAAFLGDGSSTYGGVYGLASCLNANAIQVAASTHTSATTVDLADFNNCMGLCGDYEGAQNCWFMHSAFFAAACSRLLNGLVYSVEFNGRMVPSFLGFPVVFVNVMPKALTATPSTNVAYFGDLRLGSTYGVRRAQRTDVFREMLAEQDLIAIRSSERVAIVIHERGETDANRPIVALRTAAA